MTWDFLPHSTGPIDNPIEANKMLRGHFTVFPAKLSVNDLFFYNKKTYFYTDIVQ